ncbi:MAG: zinc-binding alcohol dehydrogenase [Acidobacteria bacterium OLB17]|nr:MAG: zinc-binding alcohol dehydrogenase [Acidobacteria bacterium OLB17]MCZ2390029.1 NADPH:quinone reductase [Acidobacteriota bacterium]
MKAIVVSRFGGPEVLELKEVERPMPSSSQVVVRIGAAGVNPVDTYLRSGVYPKLPPLPYTPGKDGAGIIEEVGDAVLGFTAGDRVYTSGSLTGTYAEFTLCDEKDISRLPENVTFEQGAGVWTPYATSYRALFQKAGAKTGETVLIHGASGGVGLAAVQWAKNAGLKVIGTASSEKGLELIKENGADMAFDHSDDEHLEAILDRTDGKGVAVIIEMLANENLERDFKALAMFGRIVVVGNRGSLEFTPRLAMSKDASIFGMSLFNYSEADRIEIRDAVFKGLAEGYLKPIVSRSYSLADAPAAHRAVIENKAAGKIVLVP